MDCWACCCPGWGGHWRYAACPSLAYWPVPIHRETAKIFALQERIVHYLTQQWTNPADWLMPGSAMTWYIQPLGEDDPYSRENRTEAAQRAYYESVDQQLCALTAVPPPRPPGLFWDMTEHQFLRRPVYIQLVGVAPAWVDRLTPELVQQIRQACV